MTELTKEIAAYERLRNDLETDHFGKWLSSMTKSL